MGLIGAVAMLMGAMIGAAVFVLLGPLAKLTGPSLPLAFLLGALPAFFGSAYYIQLGSMFPSTGGTYLYTSRLLSPTLGVLAAFWILFAGIGANGMLALGFVNYISFYLGQLPIKSTAILIIIVFVIINLFGMRFSSLLQIYMVIWMVGSLLLYIVSGLFELQSPSFISVDNEPFFRNGLSGLLMATVLSFYSYAGYGLITEIGGEIRNSHKNTPRAIAISLLLVTAIYMGAAYVSTKVIPLEKFISFTASLPMAATYFLPDLGVHVIAVGGLLALFTSLNAMLLIFPHELYVMAQDRSVSPLFLVKVKRFNTPYFSLILVGFMTITLIHLGFSERVFATMTVIGFLLASILMGFASLKIFSKAQAPYEAATVKIPKPLLLFFSVLGIGCSLLFTVFAFIDEPLVGFMAMAVGLFGVLYSVVYMRGRSEGNLAIDKYFEKS